MNEPTSLGDPESPQDHGKLSTTDVSRHQTESQARSEAAQLADAVAAHAVEAEEEARLNQELERACLTTGATGAAIALVRGEDIVCRAATGLHVPDIGICLDPRTGLSGSCIQTRQLQYCRDTVTDPRVDPEVRRELGVRSIVVLPLVDGNKLLGVLEILSSRPNAFGQGDLDSLQALTDRIVESRRQNWKATSPKESGSSLHQVEEVVLQDKRLSSESGSGFPSRKRISGRNEIWSAILGVLVIASAMLLGTLVGWRLGWQKATLGFRASSPRYRANSAAKNSGPDRTAFPGKELQPSSAWTDEYGQSAAAGPPGQEASGVLTVWENGRVIFRLPPSAPSPIRNLRTSQRSPGLEADPTRR